VPRRPPPYRLLALLALASLAALAVAPCLGTEPIRAGTAWRELCSLPREAWSPDARILALRLPRVGLAWLAGGALAVSGAVLQTLLRNGLATPYTLGTASAAALGAFLPVAFPGLVLGTALLTQQGAALVLALAETILVLAVARRSRRADGLILAGVTLNFLAGAGTLLLRYLADPYELASMERWMMGALDVVHPGALLSLAPWLLLGILLLARRTPALDHLAFDPELAAARGVPVAAARRDLLLASGILVAGVVAHAGPIGFVGLLVPHALRPFTGLRHAVLLPASWLTGGAFLVLADLAARSLPVLGRHSELPVGILTALLGGPLFLWLLLRRRG